MPKPSKGEEKQKFISRCMGHDDMQRYDQDQRAAICYSYWEKRNKDINENVTFTEFLKHYDKNI